jgi:hypothetical protein
VGENEGEDVNEAEDAYQGVHICRLAHLASTGPSTRSG